MTWAGLSRLTRRGETKNGFMTNMTMAELAKFTSVFVVLSAYKVRSSKHQNILSNIGNIRIVGIVVKIIS